jgi:hypothetical protein
VAENPINTNMILSSRPAGAMNTLFCCYPWTKILRDMKLRQYSPIEIGKSAGLPKVLDAERPHAMTGDCADPQPEHGKSRRVLRRHTGVILWRGALFFGWINPRTKLANKILRLKFALRGSGRAHNLGLRSIAPLRLAVALLGRPLSRGRHSPAAGHFNCAVLDFLARHSK